MAGENEILEVGEPLDGQLEELMHQTAEQTLRLANLTDGVAELKKSLDEVAEALHAGFVELRGVTLANAEEMEKAQGPRPTEQEHRQNISERLDELEQSVAAAKGRAGALLGLALVQLLVIMALLASSFGLLPWPKQPAPAASAPIVAPAPALAAPSAPAPAVEEKIAEPKKEEMPQKKKRRR